MGRSYFFGFGVHFFLQQAMIHTVLYVDFSLCFFRLVVNLPTSSFPHVIGSPLSSLSAFVTIHLLLFLTLSYSKYIASHIASHSVRPSVCPSIPLSIVTERHVAPPSNYNDPCKGRISYGHLGRTNSCSYS